nr:CatB-related O-acetyltransferase [Roseospira navarrensis]
MYPIEGNRDTVLLRPLYDTQPPPGGGGPVEIGAWSYYSDFDDPLRFFIRNVRYHFPFSRARLVIGKFCALAHGATVVMADANHVLGGASTFPFPILGGAWAEAMPLADMPFPDRGDTVIGHDVWLGYECLVMPGVTIGPGAVVGARSVVSRDVPPYAVVAGNPARVVRRRFPPDQVARLLDLAWWDWPPEALTPAIPALVAGDLEALAKLAP